MSRSFFGLVLCVASLLALAGCAGRAVTRAELQGGRVVVTAAPFGVSVFGDDGARIWALDGFTQGVDQYTVEPQLLPGWDGYREGVDVWRPAGPATLDVEDGRVTVTFAGDDDHVGGTVIVSSDGERVRLSFALDASTQRQPRKTKLSMPLSSDEAFFGLGERFASTNHRGLSIYSFAEEGGLGGGEDPVAAAGSPFPNGPSMTYFPVPFLHSSAGYALWLDTTLRNEVHLGSTAPDRWEADVNGSHFDVVVYVGTPLRNLDLYTQDSGRPVIPAPWVWGPRRRVNFGDTQEWQRLRAAGVPTTAIDDALHFLPHNSHLGRETEIRAWTSELHAAGFKAMAYNNPYVSLTLDAADAEAAEGRENGLFLLDATGGVGETFFISGEPQTIATIDLTRPEGVAFFQSLLQRTLDLGYDGWMHDFGEYVSLDWSAGDGTFGDSLHNRFPVLSAKAAWELMSRERPDDFLYFVRSGYAGSQAFTPAVWGGDAEATFDETQGIPSALRSGLNLSMSGVPYWGSDGTGFKCLTSAPRDKEVYLRWVQLMAVSPIFMEQNACSNPLEPGQQKWTLWSDEETTTIYAAMARLHTRLQPYWQTLAREAHAHGTPLMRHVFLLHPRRIEAQRSHEGFLLGPALFAAPVVRRGATQTQVWLPPGRYVDLDDDRVYDGDAFVTLPAPLQKLPLLLVEGQLLPLLDPSIETLAEASDPDIVTPSRVADLLEVQVALARDGAASLTLVDGTVLEASPADAPLGGPIGEVRGDVVRFTVDSARSEASAVVVDGTRLSIQGPIPRRVRWVLYRLPG